MERRMTFDMDPEGYDRFRPGYADELYQEIFRYSGLSAGMRALEIGVGTGLATGPVLAAGCRVTAVEAGRDLAAYAAKRFSENPNFDVVCADFEAFEPDEPYDLIYSATAFHWIAEEIGYPKLRRLLKPGAAVALFWNRPFVGRREDALHVRLQEIYRKYRPSDAGPVEFSEKSCRRVLDALDRHGFQDVTLRLFHRTRTMRAADYLGLIGTYSDHRAMPEEAFRALRAEIGAAIQAHGGAINIYDTMDLYLARSGA